MKEMKYPPGVRFIFLLALSIFLGILLDSLFLGMGEAPSALFFFVIALSLSLPIFIISVLPWAKNQRKQTFFFGFFLLILSTYFQFIDSVSYRIEWFVFLPVIFMACFVIYKTSPGLGLSQQNRSHSGVGFRLFVFALLTTPVLTVLSVFLVENLRAEIMIFMPSAWFLIIGIIFKLLGQRIKLYVLTGELSIVLFFPILIMFGLGVSASEPKQEIFYGAAMITSFLFFLCPLILNLMKSRISEINNENAPLHPQILTSNNKPKKTEIFYLNNAGVVIIGVFAALGLVGFIVGTLVSANSNHAGGFIGMLIAMLIPFSFFATPLLLFCMGTWLVADTFVRTRRYWHLWGGLILLAIGSPLLVMAGEGVKNFLFAESEPQLEQPTNREYYVDIEYLDELIGIDEDGDGWDAYDELITDHSDHDSDNASSEDEVAFASKKLEELGWEEFKVTLTNNTSMVSAIKEEEQPLLDNDTEMEGGFVRGEPGNPVGMGWMGMNPMMMGMNGMGVMPKRVKLLEPGYDPSKLEANYGFKKIHLAVLRADLDDMKAQIMAGANINASDEVGNTPLHFALGLGEAKIAEWLMSQGVDLNAKANDGRSMTHAAAAGGQIELLKKLVVESLKLDDKNVLGQTPLHLAAAAGQTETVEWLLKQDQKVSVQDADNNTPIHLAVTHCRSGLVKRLVERGADLNVLNNAGQAAIHLACSTGQLGLVYWMLKHDDTLINLPDGGKFTPLYHAAINGNRRIASLLLSKKAKIQVGDSAELSGLFSRALDDDTEYFDRFSRDPFQDNGMGMYGMGMNPMMMGMPGMGMPGMGMPNEGEMDSEELADLIGIDQDGDGWDAYDEVITDHSDDNPNDLPSEQELEAALIKLNELGWDEFKGTLTKNTAILTGKTEEAEENKYEIFDNELVGVDEDGDGFDAWDEKITGHSDNDPADKPAGQEEVEKAQTDLNVEGNKEALSDDEDAIASQRPTGLNPSGIGLPSDTSGAWPSGTIEIEEPKPEELKALRQLDANGNSLLHLAAAIGSEKLTYSIMRIEGLSEESNKTGVTPADIAYALGRSESPLFPSDYLTRGMGMGGMFPMGMNPMMMGMYGMGGMPPGMNPMMGMYGMGGMSGMEMSGEDDNREGRISDLPPLKEPVDLSLIEWDRINISDRYESDAISALQNQLAEAERKAEEDDDDLIGVDEDGDGFDAYDERITGHSDNNAEDKPTQEEVDAAQAKLDAEEE